MFVVHEDPLHKLAGQSLLRRLCSLWLLLEPCEMLCFPFQDLTSHAVAEGGRCVEEEGKVHHLSSSRAHPMVQKSIWEHRAVPSMEASQHRHDPPPPAQRHLLCHHTTDSSWHRLIRSFHGVNFACGLSVFLASLTSMCPGARLLSLTLPVSGSIFSSLRIAHAQLCTPSLK